MASISARLERLPFFAAHRRLLFMGGIGYVFSAMEGAMIAFVRPVVRAAWTLTSVKVGLIGSSVLIGYFFRAFAAGTLGDVIGRRSVMMWSLVIYCVATLLSAVAHSWQQFFWLRIVAGFGDGAEGAIVAPFPSTFAALSAEGPVDGWL